MIKVLKRLSIQGTYHSVIKTIYSKPTTKVNVNGEKLKAISLKSGTRQVCPFYQYAFNITFEGLARAIRKLKDIKWI